MNLHCETLQKWVNQVIFCLCIVRENLLIEIENWKIEIEIDFLASALITNFLNNQKSQKFSSAARKKR